MAKDLPFALAMLWNCLGRFFVCLFVFLKMSTESGNILGVGRRVCHVVVFKNRLHFALDRLA